MITEFQYQQMLARMNRGRREAPPTAILPEDSVSKEVADLHMPIIDWCRKQNPAVPYIHARTDQQSTISIGAPDFVLFYRGRVILIECKTRTGKLKPAQLAWKLLANMQLHEFHVIRSMSEFHKLLAYYETLAPVNNLLLVSPHNPDESGEPKR